PRLKNKYWACIEKCAVAQDYPIAACLYTSLNPSFATRLPPGIKNTNRHGIGQVQAALPRQHGQTNPLLIGKQGQLFCRQACGFAAKYKYITRLKALLSQQMATTCSQGKRAIRRGASGLEGFFQTVVHLHVRSLVITQPGTTQLSVFKLNALGPHQVQDTACIGRQSNDVTRVGGDLGRNQDDMKHEKPKK